MNLSFYECRTSSRPPVSGRGKESGRPTPHHHGCVRSLNPCRPLPLRCKRWNGRRPAPPSLWWAKRSWTCRRRSERPPQTNLTYRTNSTSRETGWKDKIFCEWKWERERKKDQKCMRKTEWEREVSLGKQHGNVAVQFFFYLGMAFSLMSKRIRTLLRKAGLSLLLW